MLIFDSEFLDFDPLPQNVRVGVKIDFLGNCVGVNCLRGCYLGRQFSLQIIL